MRLIARVCVAAIAIALAGCGTHKTVIPTANGPATVETNKENNTTTFRGKEGSMTVGQNAVDVSKLGLPVYPGASQKDSGGMSTETTRGSSQVVMMTTPDSFDKVYAWYKGQMPAGTEKMHFTTPGGALASFVIGASGAKEQKSVMLTSGKDKTSIMLSVNASR